jgi:hypothetical protein
MPLPVITDTYRVALEWVNDNNVSWRATNVMHFRKSGTNPAAVYTAIDASVAANMWRHTGTDSHVRYVVITPLDGSSVSLSTATGVPAKWSGALTPGDMISQGCEIVKFKTAKRGRSYRGRVYLPWLNESTVSNNVITAGNVALSQTAWGTFFTTLISGGLSPVVAAYSLQTAEDITTLEVESNIATQRRRNVRP